MKIIICGTGQAIPPMGYGAAEEIIWQHIQGIPKLGHEVKLVNTNNWFDINWLVNQAAQEMGGCDFVAFHLDTMWPFARALSASFPVGMTSHFPDILLPEKYNQFGYQKVVDYFVDNSHDNFNFCLSEKHRQFFADHGAKKDKLFLLKNGASEDIKFTDSPTMADKSICLGKICARKRQEHLALLLKSKGCGQDVDYCGPIAIEDHNVNLQNLGNNYIGEWTRAQIENNLTNYGNSISLSVSESTTNLVVRESLVAGLGVCITETNADQLVDIDKHPFITVIPDDKLNDAEYVNNAIQANREISLKMRPEIRQYGLDNFGWDNCVRDYLKEIEKALDSIKK